MNAPTRNALLAFFALERAAAANASGSTPETRAELRRAARQFVFLEEQTLPPHARCGHSACAQHYIDTGNSVCVQAPA